MREQVIKCDGCGKIRGEGNHWFGSKLCALPDKKYMLTLATFDSITFETGWEHFCGEECLLRMVARNLPK